MPRVIRFENIHAPTEMHMMHIVKLEVHVVSRSGPYRSIQVHSGPFRSIQVHTGPYRSIQVYLVSYMDMEQTL